MPVDANDLETAIRNAVPVAHLEIHDMSSGCGQSYSVVIVSEAFQGMGTLARHRMVNEFLKDMIAQMHAFSQRTFTPTQWEEEQAKLADA